MPERGYFEQRLGVPHPEVGPPDAPEEREADATADRVMRTPGGGAENVGGRATAAQPLGKSGEADRHAMMQGGAPLAPSARGYFEPRFGQDLGHVRIHTGPAAAASAQALGARAFALGPHIGFAAGHYAPERAEDRRLLAHELAHVARRHTGLRRDGPPGMPEGGVTVALVATTDPLERYAGLRDALGMEGWEALNDAARLRDARQSNRRKQVSVADAQNLAAAARDTLQLPLAKLLQPRPYTEFGQFRNLLFDSLRAGQIGQGAASIDVRDEIARRWASRHEDVVRGDLEVRLVDPQGTLDTPDELLFLIAGQPVATLDGQLWISAVDAAVSPGDLAGVIQDVSNDANDVAEAANLANESEKLTDLARQMRQKPHEEVAGNDAEAMSGVLTRAADQGAGLRNGAHHGQSAARADPYNALTGEGAEFKSWLEAHRKFLAEHQPKQNLPEQEYQRTADLMKAYDDAPWYAKGFVRTGCQPVGDGAWCGRPVHRRCLRCRCGAAQAIPRGQRFSQGIRRGRGGDPRPRHHHRLGQCGGDAGDPRAGRGDRAGDAGRPDGVWRHQFHGGHRHRADDADLCDLAHDTVRPGGAADLGAGRDVTGRYRAVFADRWRVRRGDRRRDGVAGARAERGAGPATGCGERAGAGAGAHARSGSDRAGGRTRRGGDDAGGSARRFALHPPGLGSYRAWPGRSPDRVRNLERANEGADVPGHRSAERRGRVPVHAAKRRTDGRRGGRARLDRARTGGRRSARGRGAHRW